MWYKLSFFRKKPFSALTEKEILSLAITIEAKNKKKFLFYAAIFQNDYPQTSIFFEQLASIKQQHASKLLELYKQRFGDNIICIKKEDIYNFPISHSYVIDDTTTPMTARQDALTITKQLSSFYQQATQLVNDIEIKEFLNQLFFEEYVNNNSLIKEADVDDIQSEYAYDIINQEEKQTLLTWIQPGLAGLMDGSISTLAPIFAAAFATQNSYQTLLVGLSASIGAGISMGFTEAIHDDGKLSGRGSPLKRGIANGTMTTVGGLGHTLPYLLSNFILATILAVIIVIIELFTIAWIQKRYMKISFSKASLQVILGGFLVLATGILIGNL
ncbi:ferritin family protein [Bartonella sp. DGB1]|uniref:ferritin family protein n=1 Tax=Bartonella sp. DGB1 TaxID=3239807 RepID=UPI003525A9A0